MIPGVINQAWNSALGNVERAVIEIIEYDSKNRQKEAVIQKKAENVLTKAEKSSGLNQETGQISGTSRKYLVQFNPEKLTLEAEGSCVEEKGGNTDKTDDTESETKIKYGVLKANITLTVTLIFNQVNVEDSFLWEKFRLDPSALIAGTIRGIGNGVTGREYTVQTEVEGFLAALRNRNRREIIFSWGDTEYRGILSSVNSTYKMFSVSGKPVHAEVTLKIDCTKDGAGKNSLGVWEQYYREVFLEADGLNLERGVQNVGNLFQLS